MMTGAQATALLRQVKAFVLTIRLTDAVDIIVIATLIYLLLVWFERARARFMLVGMMIVGLIYVLARVFGMYLTTLVFQAFFAISLIMIVVIFQDDFRQFFERIALWSLSKRRRLKEKVSLGKEIDILTSGVANLSRKRIGALIILRGTDPLDRYLEAGTRLDGLLNEILLESIFDPHVPSHDGAMIVDGMRIARFSAHLPLSANMEEVGHLGTRHAAALGITERSDALSIVVSEQRGTVSVAEGGRIKQLIDITDLGGILKKFYQKRYPEQKKTTLGRFLKGHFLEKVIALLLAFGLWITFGHRTDIVRRDYVVPVEYRNLAANRIIQDPKQNEVSVTLSGSERVFSLISPNELKVSLDMSGVADGENDFTLTKDLIRYPAGLSVVNIEPNDIRLKVYTLVTMKVPVTVKTKGSVPPNVTLRGITIEPKEVQVSGSSAIKKETIYISTEPIDLDTITDTKTVTPRLIVSPESVRFPDEKSAAVKVTVTVDRQDAPREDEPAPVPPQ